MYLVLFYHKSKPHPQGAHRTSSLVVLIYPWLQCLCHLRSKSNFHWLYHNNVKTSFKEGAIIWITRHIFPVYNQALGMDH